MTEPTCTLADLALGPSTFELHTKQTDSVMHPDREGKGKDKDKDKGVGLTTHPVTTTTPPPRKQLQFLTPHHPCHIAAPGCPNPFCHDFRPPLAPILTPVAAPQAAFTSLVLCPLRRVPVQDCASSRAGVSSAVLLQSSVPCR